MKSSLTLNHSYHSFNSLDEHDLIIDLTEFITNLSFGNALGYYFADEQESPLAPLPPISPPTPL